MYTHIIVPLKSWLSENITQAYIFLGANFGFSILPLQASAQTNITQEATSVFQLITAIIATITALLILWGRVEAHREARQMKQDLKNKDKRANEKATEQHP